MKKLLLLLPMLVVAGAYCMGTGDWDTMEQKFGKRKFHNFVSDAGDSVASITKCSDVWWPGNFARSTQAGSPDGQVTGCNQCWIQNTGVYEGENARLYCTCYWGGGKPHFTAIFLRDIKTRGAFAGPTGNTCFVTTSDANLVCSPGSAANYYTWQKSSDFCKAGN